MNGTIYLLHFHPRYKHAGHYLGWTRQITQRLDEHRSGSGARLTQVAVQAGCELVLVRTWRGTRDDEHTMKYSRIDEQGKPIRRHSLTRLCPICNSKLNISVPYRGGLRNV